jgi:site-specific recombinase XerD
MSLYEKLKFAVAQNSHDRNTLDSYWAACRKFYRFCGKPASQWSGPDVERWLVSLHDQDYSRSSRKNALCAMAYVFKHVLKADMGRLNLPPMPPERKPLKIIPSREEIGRIFAGLKGSPRLITALLYGSGTRIGESCELRVQDIDFEALTVRIHGGKGDKDRMTVLPVMLVPALQRQIAWRKSLHDIDLANGGGFVELPGRLDLKYKNAKRELRWQYLFPSAVTRGQYRWHITTKAVQDAVRAAVNAAGIMKRVTPHTLRHAFATHSMRMGNDIETVRDLLGHDSIGTTAIYLHADGARGRSPLDVALKDALPLPTVLTERGLLNGH